MLLFITSRSHKPIKLSPNISFTLEFVTSCPSIHLHSCFNVYSWNWSFCFLASLSTTLWNIIKISLNKIFLNFLVFLPHMLIRHSFLQNHSSPPLSNLSLDLYRSIPPHMLIMVSAQTSIKGLYQQPLTLLSTASSISHNQCSFVVDPSRIDGLSKMK